MASVSSLDKDLARLRRSKYTPAAAAAVGDWIASTLGEPLPRGDLMDVLKDGTVLCRLVNHLGGSKKQIRFKQSRMPFVQMENIAQFLAAVSSPPINLPPHDRFLTVDLYEKKDPAQVLQCLGAFSRVAHNIDPAAFRDTVGGLKGAVALGEKAGAGAGADTGADTGARAGAGGGGGGGAGGGPKREPSVGVKTSAWTKKEEEGSTAPAWNVVQYGYMGGASQGNQGITFGGRRQITATAPVAGAGLSPAEKERRRPAEEAERARLRQQLQEDAEREERAEALRRQEAEQEAEAKAKQQRQAEAEARAEAELAAARRRAREQRQAEQRLQDEQRRREHEAEARRKADALRQAELTRLEHHRQQKGEEAERQRQRQLEEERRLAWQRQRDQERSHEAELQRERERVRELERELAKARERERLYEAEKEARRREETERMRRDAADAVRHRSGGDKPRSVAPHRTGDRPLPPPPPPRQQQQHGDGDHESVELEEEERRFLQNSWVRETIATPPITEPADSRPSSIVPPRALPTPPPRKLPVPPPLRPKLSWERGDDEKPLDSPTKEPAEAAEAALNWSNMSFLERERERERQRQKEWERDQMESQRIAQRQSGVVAGTSEAADDEYGYADDILDLY